MQYVTYNLQYTPFYHSISFRSKIYIISTMPSIQLIESGHSTEFSGFFININFWFHKINRLYKY